MKEKEVAVVHWLIYQSTFFIDEGYKKVILKKKISLNNPKKV